MLYGWSKRCSIDYGKMKYENLPDGSVNHTSGAKQINSNVLCSEIFEKSASSQFNNNSCQL